MFFLSPINFLISLLDTFSEQHLWLLIITSRRQFFQCFACFASGVQFCNLQWFFHDKPLACLFPEESLLRHLA